MSVAAKPSTAPSPTPATKPEARSPIPGILMALVLAAVMVLAWVGTTPTMPWAQGYDPFGHWWLSTIFAALPVIVLLGTLAIFRMKAHYSALLGLVTALLIAAGVFHMPVKMASITAIYGACLGLFPIDWIILNVIFLYRMTLQTGRFKVLQESMTGIIQDTRLQLLLIAFSFGASLTLRAADRAVSGPDGGSQQCGWGDGQNDRCAKHRRRQYGDRMVWTRGRHLALRVLAQYCSGMPCGSDGVHASVCVSVHQVCRALAARA
jgi:hypothetical protein